MITPVSSATHAQPVAQAKPAAQPAVPSKPQSAPADTVQISSAAQQALKETIETPAQTAREAAGGDAVAKRLLAKEAADKTL
jgi:formaldehyde-activating enzyme involved in methanogenesis